MSPTPRNEEHECLSEVRDKTSALIGQAIDSESSILIEAPPASGKTTAVFRLASQLDAPISYLTKREDLYHQAIDLGHKFGSNPTLIPSPFRDCDCFSEDHPDYHPEAVRLYELGVSGWRIHDELDLPCSPCDYLSKWERFDPESTDLIVGHYKHGYLDSVVQDRVVIIDEFPGNAFEQVFDDVDELVSRFLRSTKGIPFDNWVDFLEHRDDKQRLVEAQVWFLKNGAAPAPERVLALNENDRYHTLVPYIIWALLYMKNRGNDFESCLFSGKWGRFGIERERYVAFNRENENISILTPPQLGEARAVVGLDGTPAIEMWEKVTGEDFAHWRTHEKAEEKNRYVKETLQLTLIQAGRGMKPYHGGNVTLNRDAGILYGVGIREGQKPALITTDKALQKYREAGLLRYTKKEMNYASVVSSNSNKGDQIGVIQGAPHPGDQILKKWGCYFANTIEGEGRGVDRSYGEFGDKIYRHFVHDQVLQAILRFGRGQSPATVYLNTLAVPEWLETDETVSVQHFNTKSKREIGDYLRFESNGATRSEIAAAADVSERTVSNVLTGFEELGLIDSLDQPGPHPTIYQWA